MHAIGHNDQHNKNNSKHVDWDWTQPTIQVLQLYISELFQIIVSWKNDVCFEITG